MSCVIKALHLQCMSFFLISVCVYYHMIIILAPSSVQSFQRKEFYTRTLVSTVDSTGDSDELLVGVFTHQI